jgi:lipoate-protein ligase A
VLALFTYVKDMNKITQIVYCEDVKSIDGALSMALDEVLLQDGRAMLRGYYWIESMFSLGSFVKVSDVENIRKNEGILPIVRRITGGGCVFHEENRDFSYSLIVPRSEKLAGLRPFETYRWIHERLAEILCECGVDAELTAEDLDLGGENSRDCYRKPVTWDVIAGGVKVAGAGQKLGKWGFLHQGNVRGVELPGDFVVRLAAKLSDAVEAFEITPEIWEKAEKLANEKYRNADWTEKY